MRATWPRRALAVVASTAAMAIALVLLLVTALFHYLYVFEASLSCPDLDGHTGVPQRGGWGSGSTCRYELASGTRDSSSLDSEPLNWIVPWWSAVISLLVVLTLGVLLFALVRFLWRWSRSDENRADGWTDAGGSALTDADSNQHGSAKRIHRPANGEITVSTPPDQGAEAPLRSGRNADRLSRAEREARQVR